MDRWVALAWVALAMLWLAGCGNEAPPADKAESPPAPSVVGKDNTAAPAVEAHAPPATVPAPKAAVEKEAAPVTLPKDTSASASEGGAPLVGHQGADRTPVTQTSPTKTPTVPASAAGKVKKEALLLSGGAVALSHGLSQIIGVAISPLIGVVVMGIHGWYNYTPGSGAAFNWYWSPWVWAPCLLLVLLVALKDTLGPLNPVLKKLVDAAELLENKLSGVIAAPIVLTAVIDQFGTVLGFSTVQLLQSLDPVAYAAEAAAADPGLLDRIAYAVGAFEISVAGSVVYALVWLVSHSVQVLVLLNPFPVLDIFLKSLRLAIIAPLLVSNAIHPMLGLLVSLLYLYVAYRLAGWSLRLLVLGWVFAWDLLTLRSWRFHPRVEETWAFAAKGLRDKVAPRTYGRLVRREDGQLEFHYRPWMVLPPRALPVPESAAKLAVGTGLTHACLVDAGPDESPYTIYLRFPPRYQRHEKELTAFFGLGETRDVSCLRGLRLAWRWLMGEYRENREQKAAMKAVGR